MELENDGFLHLLPMDTNDMYYATTPFPIMPSQESNFGALYLDHGPWITQKLDIAQPPPNDAQSSSSSATQISKLESDLSSQSQPSSRVQVPLPSIRQRTAQACDKCRERKTKVCANIFCILYVRRYWRYLGLQCSGHRPVCLRCTARGLACEYSTRLRLPTRTRFHPGYMRPITDPKPARSGPGNDSQPTPVYPAMALSRDRWDGYQQELFVDAAYDMYYGLCQ